MCGKPQSLMSIDGIFWNKVVGMCFWGENDFFEKVKVYM